MKFSVKKTTMERVNYEDSLLLYYKKFLQKVEKMTSNLSKGGGSKRRLPAEYIKLGEVATTCLCELLLAHPYFNFSQNVAQLLVYLLNSNFPSVRTNIWKCFREVFKQDSRFDLTLFVSWSWLCLYYYLAGIDKPLFSDCASVEPSDQV